jgi:hypothetical protein
MVGKEVNAVHLNIGDIYSDVGAGVFPVPKLSRSQAPVYLLVPKLQLGNVNFRRSSASPPLDKP